MQIRVLILLNLLVMASVAIAGETLSLLTVGPNTYKHVAIFKTNATDIFFTSDQGLGNVKLKDLGPEMQKHFNFNATNAAAVEQKRKKGAALYHLQVVGEADKASSISIEPNNPAAVKAEIDDAVARVEQIVNQPVTRLTRTPEMSVATYSPGWFHPGAVRPDFKTVDVHATQSLDFEKNQYVTSDLNPGVVFLGGELEFNAMTKMFYTDRSLPKKKLTEAEMLEINRLYRVIGRDEDGLEQMQEQPVP